MNARSHLAQWISRRSTLVILVTVLLLIALATDLFGTLLIRRIVTVLFINLTLVLGLQTFMGNSGILSFAHIGFMGIGAFASVVFSMTPEAKAMAVPNMYPFLIPIHWDFLPSLLAGAVIVAMVAAIVGFPLMRLSDAAAVITTFALLVIIHVVLIHWDNFTNGPRTLFGVEPYTTLWMSAAWSIFFVLVAYGFKESPLGLKLRASRDDRYAASTIGINIVVVRWAAFALSAFIAAIGGGLWAHFITSFSPNNFYMTETFVVLAMLVIGGPSSVSGAVVGTLAVTIVFETLRGIENAINISQALGGTLVGFTEVFLAIALIAILILRPAGIMKGQEIRWPRKPAQIESNQAPADHS